MGKLIGYAGVALIFFGAVGVGGYQAFQTRQEVGAAGTVSAESAEASCCSEMQAEGCCSESQEAACCSESQATSCCSASGECTEAATAACCASEEGCPADEACCADGESCEACTDSIPDAPEFPASEAAAEISETEAATTTEI